MRNVKVITEDRWRRSTYPVIEIVIRVNREASRVTQEFEASLGLHDLQASLH